jgi:hypothetical protein
MSTCGDRGAAFLRLRLKARERCVSEFTVDEYYDHRSSGFLIDARTDLPQVRRDRTSASRQ